MNRLELIAYYSDAYKFLQSHMGQHLAMGPMEPWRRARAILQAIDGEVTRLVTAMLLDGEGCADAQGSVNATETRVQ